MSSSEGPSALGFRLLGAEALVTDGPGGAKGVVSGAESNVPAPRTKDSGLSCSDARWSYP